MASRRPAQDYEDDAPPSNKRPRIENEDTDRLHIRGGGGKSTSNPVPQTPTAGTLPVPESARSYRKSPVRNDTNPQAVDQPRTPPNQTATGPTSQSPRQPQSRTDRVLAVARASTPCTLKVGTDELNQPVLENVILVLKVQVHTCLIPLETRLGYSGAIFLRRDGRPDQHIGNIEGWRVSKPCRAQPTIDPQYMIRELLRTPLNSFPENSSWTELAYALRAVYTLDGRPRAVVDAQVRPTLGDGGSELVFVQMLKIMWTDEDGTVVSLGSPFYFSSSPSPELTLSPDSSKETALAALP